MSAPRKVAIVGGGVIGGGWAARFLLPGWRVAVFDPAPDAQRRIGEVLDNARRSLPALADVPMPAEGLLRFVDTLPEAVTGADWIQESVPERLDLKHKVLAHIQRYAPASAIIGSSTSGFKPSALQQGAAALQQDAAALQLGAAAPGRILVTHPFNPVYLLPLVELVASEPEVIDPVENISSRTATGHTSTTVAARPRSRFVGQPGMGPWEVNGCSGAIRWK